MRTNTYHGALILLFLNLWIGCSADAESTVREDGGATIADGAVRLPDLGPEPTNTSCAKAMRLAMPEDGRMQLVARIGGGADEFGGVACSKVDATSQRWQGPQVYYRVALEAGVHRLTLKPSGWDGAFYAFAAQTECRRQNIDAACDGLSSDQIGVGRIETLFLHARQNGEWIIAVDSISPKAVAWGGTFVLAIEKLAAPKGAMCSAATTHALQTTRTEISGTTVGAFDEFDRVHCGGANATPFRGGQAYHRLRLAAKTNYRVIMSAASDLSLYAFPAQTACAAVAINAACRPKAPLRPTLRTVSRSVNSGEELLLLATGDEAEDWVVVVDSTGTQLAGSYTLFVDTYSPPSNSNCKDAQKVKLDKAGVAKVRADTTGLEDEYPNIDCGGPTGPWSGPQLYYRAWLRRGRRYRARLTKLNFDAALYAFRAACSEYTVNVGCQSTQDDSTNRWWSDRAGNVAEEVLIRPDRDGDWTFAVDALAEFGKFELEIREVAPETAGRCETPTVVSLKQSPTVLKGTTLAVGVQNEFGDGITCASGGGPWSGPQLYYKMSLLAGKRYTVSLEPTGWDGALYAFSATTACSSARINQACRGGLFADGARAVNEILQLSPQKNEDWVIAIDSWNGLVAGEFSLRIVWK